MDYKNFLTALESGEIRVAQKDSGEWRVDLSVKQGILEIFKNSRIVDIPGGFFDKELLMPRVFKSEDKVRIVPGGSSIRAGAYIGANVVIMPPSYVNIGAYVDDGTMIDSHVLVGSCAQIGRNVHLSAGVQIGGVLEPIGYRPVIIEDDCFIGAGAVLVEGVLVRKKAVIAPGVVLSASIPIYDLTSDSVYKCEIPERSVVVPGSRNIKEQINVNCAVIIKYRDEKTDLALLFEDILRT
ncbi:MAG: 2,3,4,5-tetrahydropyridine-2,6-dicarboxylate N-succinyltransferase [Holosporales bacterium]|jgi:2,3,4,5-tetrahydropyridine-2-carboxylate N-succinyltransferase|nr:2,3,4,5-tetrahydropyridine-2,6-dicarboxylate N-succinyltransferase [Holosporales bacterium]